MFLHFLLFLTFCRWRSAEAQTFTASVEGPIFLNETTSAYYCVLFDSRVTTNENYEVTFLFDNNEEPDVPRFNVTNSNDRVFLSEKYVIGKMRKQMKCRVRAHRENDFSATTTEIISTIFINLGVEPEFYRSTRDEKITCKSCVQEKDIDPLRIVLETTVPFRCQNGSFNCPVTVNYTTSAEIVIPKTKENPKPCETTLIPSLTNGKTTNEVKVTAVKDDFVSPIDRSNSLRVHFPSFPDIEIDGKTYQDNWDNFDYQIDIKHIDNKRSFCTVSGYSSVKTFDGYSYTMPGIGQFKYVESILGTPFNIQLRHWPCGPDNKESCVCGIAVEETSTTDVVVDMCVDGTPYFINRRCFLFPTDSGVKIIANEQKNRFAIIFPSGVSIYGSIVGQQMSVDIYIPPNKINTVTGLCGLFDGNADDSSTVTDFEQWRLAKGQSIFDGKLGSNAAPSSSLPTQSSNDEYCSCTLGIAKCSFSSASFSSLDQYQYGMTNVQPKGPAGNACHRIEAEYYSNSYMYYEGGKSSSAYSWPTSSGISEAEASAYCRSYLWDDSPLKPLCASVTNVDSFIEKCKREIQISGYLESAVNIEPELGRFCLFNGAATATESGFSGLGNLKNLSDAYCESFSCTKHGTCENGVCKCSGAFVNQYSKDCSYDTTGKLVNYTGPLCDYRTQQCDHLLIGSQDIDSIFPECKFKVKTAFFNPFLSFTLGQITKQGSTVTENKTMCYTPLKYRDYITVPDNRAVGDLSQGTPILFDLSAYNAKSQNSESLPALLYDSYCYDCFENLTCVRKNLTDGCRINDYCYKDGTVKFNDPSFHCDITKSVTAWTKRVVPTTTTTTLGPTTKEATTTAALTTTVKATTTVITKAVETTTVKITVKNELTTLTTKSVTQSASEDEELDLLLDFFRKQNPTGDAAKINETASAILAQLKNDTKCSGFEAKMKSDPPTPISSLSVQENNKAFVLKYCNGYTGAPSEEEELDNLLGRVSALTDPLFQTTTQKPPVMTTQALKPNLKADLTNWLQNSGTTASPEEVENLLDKNPDCRDSEIIASIKDAPVYDKTASVEQNAYAIASLYCKNNSAFADSLIALLKSKDSTPTDDPEELGLLADFLKKQNPADDAAINKTASALLAQLKNTTKCSGFEAKMKSDPPKPIETLGVKENNKAFVLKYCSGFTGAPSEEEELDNLLGRMSTLTDPLFQITTVSTLTPPPKPNLRADLTNWLKNSGLPVSPEEIENLIDKNSDCADSEIIAAVKEAPAYDKTASLEQNAYAIASLYCKNNSAFADSLIALLKSRDTSANNADNLGAILGGVIGGLMGLALLSLLCCVCGPTLYNFCCPIASTKCAPKCYPKPQYCSPIARPAFANERCNTNVTNVINLDSNFRPYSPKNTCGIASSGLIGNVTRYRANYLRPNYGCRPFFY